MDFTVIFSVTLYKLTCLIVGFGCCYLGYLLFKSVQPMPNFQSEQHLATEGNESAQSKSSGDINIHLGENKLELKNSTPGSVLVFMGGAIVIFTIWQGYKIDGLPVDNLPVRIQSTMAEGPVSLPKDGSSLADKLGKKDKADENED